MIWSLVKIIFFVGIIGALAWGASFLLEAQGGMQIRALGFELNFGPLQAILLIIAMVLSLIHI